MYPFFDLAKIEFAIGISDKGLNDRFAVGTHFRDFDALRGIIADHNDSSHLPGKLDRCDLDDFCLRVQHRGWQKQCSKENEDESDSSHTGTGTLSTISLNTCSACSAFFNVDEYRALTTTR